MTTLPSEKKWEELYALMESLGIQEKDLEEKFILGGGSGGQKVNKTHSCVQLRHLPTNTLIKCQQERSREANRFFARRILCERFERGTPKRVETEAELDDEPTLRNRAKKRLRTHPPEFYEGPNSGNAPQKGGSHSSFSSQTKQIQWFPGHMSKAKRQMEEKLKLIDIIIDVRDARAPESSQNPIIAELAARKKRVVVLTKIDLADPKATLEWLQFYNRQNMIGIGINTLTKANCDALVKACLTLSEKQKKEGLQLKETRVMIAGIPNVGKSALINALAKRKITDVQNRPAVTKRQQWISLGEHLALLDTPGVLWPKFENQDIGQKLAALGSIKDELLSKEDLAFYLITFLINSYPKSLKTRYGILPEQLTSPLETLEQIGIKRACKARGGDVDFDKVYELLIQDFRKGKLGLITLEKP